jgi:hypothetical protein
MQIHEAIGATLVVGARLAVIAAADRPWMLLSFSEFSDANAAEDSKTRATEAAVTLRNMAFFLLRLLRRFLFADDLT